MVSITAYVTSLIYWEPISVVSVPIPDIFTWRDFYETLLLSCLFLQSKYFFFTFYLFVVFSLLTFTHSHLIYLYLSTFSIFIPCSFHLVSGRSVSPEESFGKGNVAYLLLIKKTGTGCLIQL